MCFPQHSKSWGICGRRVLRRVEVALKPFMLSEDVVVLGACSTLALQRTWSSFF